MEAAAMSVELSDHQLKAIEQLKTGSILRGGVGSGKSRTAIAYYYMKECGGVLEINGRGHTSPLLFAKDLYIITTAKKRDTLDWYKECIPFSLSPSRELSVSNVQVTIDSWNNISKYCNVCGAFFIFDEQRVIGSGAWVKSFYQICKKNHWILLSATPGDVWKDYIPIFVANGFYKNKTEFEREHAIFNRYTRYPKIDGYQNERKLTYLKERITVYMDDVRHTVRHVNVEPVDFDADLYFKTAKNRWNPYRDEPIREISECCHVLRRITNESRSRIEKAREYIRQCPKLIIFYNFDYELDILRQLGKEENVYVAEWNGHKHMPVPTYDKWIYLVQYNAGAEGWNCIETNVILFYSDNPSYRTMEQASGRIDRMNTPFTDLYYIHLRSRSPRDVAIAKALREKMEFNENRSVEEEIKRYGWVPKQSLKS